MSEYGQAQFIEILSTARVKTDLGDPLQKSPAIVITVRPKPDRSWTFHNLGLTLNQAERLRDDLTSLLSTSVTFVLVAVLTLATGCSARVEVSNETIPAAQADPDSVPPVAALEKHRTAVEVDFLGQGQPEAAVEPVANEQPVATTEPMPTNTDGIQVNGNGNTIEFHFHRHRRSRSPVMVYPVVRHEMVIVPSDGSAPIVFMDNAPPRVALVDKQVARAYAAHMLRLAQREGHR